MNQWTSPDSSATGPRPPQNRGGLIIAGVTALVLILNVAGFFAVTTIRDASARWVVSARAAKEPRPRPRTASPSPTRWQSQVPNPSRTSVVPSTSQVPIGPGELVFNGKTTLKGAGDVQVGFILAADASSLSNLTLVLSDLDIPKVSGISKITHSTQRSFDIVNNRVEASWGTGTTLVLTFAGNKAAGTLKYASTLGGFGNQPKVNADLGSAPIVVESR